MKEKINERGFVESVSFWNKIKCFFGHHYWMCHTPIDRFGNYMSNHQMWMCRRCTDFKTTFYHHVSDKE